MLHRQPARILLIILLAAAGAAAFAESRPEPLQFGNRKQLFIDDLFFAEKSGISLSIHPPVKDARPVLVPETGNPWEANRISAGNSVVDDNGEIRIYYDAISPCPFDYDKRKRWLCVAVSKDGIHFEKPKLGIVPFDNRTDTNIVWPPKLDNSHEPGNVFIDTNPQCPPEERYKLVGTWEGKTRMAFSADGLHWTAYPNPSFRNSDTTNAVCFDNLLGCYVGWARFNQHFGPEGNDGQRQVARCTFSDPRDNWGAETAVFHADEEDVRHLDKTLFSGIDHYCGGVNVYQPAPGVYFGMPAAYYHFHKDVSLRRGRGGTRSPGNDGNIEVQLITSRDGIHWNRPERGKPFIPRGPDGSWDYGMTYVCGGSNLVYRGDEVWLYYSAQPFTHGDYALDKKEALGSVMRAVSRLDGFVSADAGMDPGEFTTPAMVFDGKQLMLNVDTGGGGHLRVELQDENGKPIDGFALGDCDVINGNYIRQTVSWKGQSDLSVLVGKPIRMHVQMRSANLYSFQFTNP